MPRTSIKTGKNNTKPYDASEGDSLTKKSKMKFKIVNSQAEMLPNIPSEEIENVYYEGNRVVLKFKNGDTSYLPGKFTFLIKATWLQYSGTKNDGSETYGPPKNFSVKGQIPCISYLIEEYGVKEVTKLSFDHELPSNKIDFLKKKGFLEELIQRDWSCHLLCVALESVGMKYSASNDYSLTFKKKWKDDLRTDCGVDMLLFGKPITFGEPTPTGASYLPINTANAYLNVNFSTWVSDKNLEGTKRFFVGLKSFNCIYHEPRVQKKDDDVFDITQTNKHIDNYAKLISNDDEGDIIDVSV
jgi:hypothetical protein